MDPNSDSFRFEGSFDGVKAERNNSKRAGGRINSEVGESDDGSFDGVKAVYGKAERDNSKRFKAKRVGWRGRAVRWHSAMTNKFEAVRFEVTSGSPTDAEMRVIESTLVELKLRLAPKTFPDRNITWRESRLAN